MIIDFTNRRFFVISNYSYMSTSLEIVGSVLQHDFEKDIFDGNYYIFISRNSKTLRVTYWEINGFCSWKKTVYNGCFPKPKGDSGIEEINFEEFKLLLKGINIFTKHKPILNKNFS